MCPAHNPRVSLPIPLGVFPGRIIRVKGRTPACSQRFAINLQCGPKFYAGEDIVFHFNPRFAQKRVVRNHYECSKWGVEEISDSVPMNSGDPFEALIYCYYDKFKVDVNGQFFCEFTHRMPYQKISHIMVEGDIEIDNIDFIGVNSPADTLLSVPYNGVILGGVYPGRIIVIRGTVLPSANKFAIDFRSGSRDNALHFNPRFGQHQIVRNSYLNGSWGAEETEGGLPLMKGEPFVAVFKCTHTHFQVSLNGNYFCDFAYRSPYHAITHLTVVGDVLLQEIAYEGPEPPLESAPLVRYATSSSPMCCCRATATGGGARGAEDGGAGGAEDGGAGGAKGGAAGGAGDDAAGSAKDGPAGGAEDVAVGVAGGAECYHLVRQLVALKVAQKVARLEALRAVLAQLGALRVARRGRCGWWR